MEAIYPITDLHRNTKSVQAAARNGIVHITEGGRGTYVFCSEEVFEKQIESSVQEALYAERMANAIRQGKLDVEANRSVHGVENIMDAIEKTARG